MGFRERMRCGKLMEGVLRRSRCRLAFILLISVFVFLQGICARAQQTNCPSTFAVGVHSGFSTSIGKDLFLKNELYANWNLPVDWRLGSRWHLQPRFQLTAGYLQNSDDAFIASLGLALIFTYGEFPVGLDLGISPTYIGRDNFEGKKLGFPFEFTSHIGFEWKIHRHWELSYRAEHMSNLHLGRSNPGLNMHLFGIGYRF